MFAAVLSPDTIAPMLDRFEMTRGLSDAARRELFDRIAHMQNDGYDFDAAGGSLELLIREALNPDARPFEIAGFEVTTRMIGPDRTQSTASVSVRIQEAILVGEAVCGGPINALDTALRNCLANLYPAVTQVKLTDYRVQILEPQKGTAARAGIQIEWTDGSSIWCTMGVSDNVVEASWLALVGAMRLELMRIAERDQASVWFEDNSWAV
jgi:2-isopropylmalate synthase